MTDGLDFFYYKSDPFHKIQPDLVINFSIISIFCHLQMYNLLIFPNYYNPYNLI